MQPELLFAYARLQQMGANLLALLPSFVLGCLVFIVFIFIARIIKALVQRLNARRHYSLALVMGRLAQWGVLLFGLLVSVTIAFPSFTPANLISALGITGIAVGFAFKDIFENFLAGILILATEPFRIDDQIVFGSYEGTVERIETRATLIRTYDGRRVVIPNAELFKGSFVVNTAYDSRRLEHDIGIGTSDDIQLAKRLMLDVVTQADGVLSEPKPDALVVSFAESGINIRLRWWIHPPRRADVLDIQDRVLEGVKNALIVNGIDLPYPTRQILFHDQTEETDGDRSSQREGWPAGKVSPPRARSVAAAIFNAIRKKSQPSPEHRSDSENGA
jgi:small-conductance mechanosensitive channel